MIAIAIAAFLGVVGIGYARAHVSHDIVICADDDKYIISTDEDGAFTAVNGRPIPRGATVHLGAPTCHFNLETYHSGPLLFR